MFHNLNKVLLLRKWKDSYSCVNASINYTFMTCQIRQFNRREPISTAHHVMRKKIFNKQDERSSKQRQNSSNAYLPHVIYFSVGVSLAISIYNYMKTHNPFKSFLHCQIQRNLIPSVSAAVPFFNSEKNEKESSDTNTSSPPGSGYRKSNNFIADVVEKVSEGVVFIEIKDHRRTDFAGKMFSISNGSGFIIDPSGLILTNAHVVANRPRATTIMVRLADGREFEGRVEELDTISDLALVRIKTNGLKALNLGCSRDLRPGEFVVALGSPLSLSNTITAGVVSSIGRASKDLGLRGRDIDYIQTDAAITFGNSGGPLVNLDGEVIGINSMKVTSGISFAIPVDSAKEFLTKAEKRRSFIVKHKSEETLPRRRYLGITMLSLTPEVITQMQQRSPGAPGPHVPDTLTHGILVWRIVVGSPAYHAGLEPGDIVTHINGHEIQSSRDVYKILETKSDLNMVVLRKGQRYSVSVCPEE